MKILKTDEIINSEEKPFTITTCFDTALEAIALPLSKVETSDLETSRLIVRKFLKNLKFISNHVEKGKIDDNTELPYYS